MNREDFGARLSQPQRAKMQKIALSPNSEAETADYADDTDKQAWRRNRPDEFEGRAVNKTRLSSVQSAQSAVLISFSELSCRPVPVGKRQCCGWDSRAPVWLRPGRSVPLRLNPLCLGHPHFLP